MALHPSLHSEFKKIVGANHVLTGEDVSMRSTSWVRQVPCEASAIIRPGSTHEVSLIVKLCSEHKQKMVVHGGRTGLAGGVVATVNDIVISLERLTDIGSVDKANRTISVGAGATLEAIQNVASDAGLYFALDLGARGTATIGGAVATNAGGLNVIRFGMAREQILGLEVVLPNGEILTTMHGLIKNNTGYDLKQLFVGAEGTLGIVTRVLLRLRFAAPDVNTAILTVPTYADTVDLLHRLESKFVGTVSSFEVMWPAFYRRVTDPKFCNAPPLPVTDSMYVIIEVLVSGDSESDSAFIEVLSDEIENGPIEDAVIAQSEKDRQNIWTIRENFEAFMDGVPGLPFDVSLRLNDIPNYLDKLQSELEKISPDVLLIPFGHLGDNNIHLTIKMPDTNKIALQKAKTFVYELLSDFGGSVSAEHGIGTEKIDYLQYSRSLEEISVMRQIKGLFDPQQILNPHVLFK